MCQHKFNTWSARAFYLYSGHNISNIVQYYAPIYGCRAILRCINFKNRPNLATQNNIKQIFEKGKYEPKSIFSLKDFIAKHIKWVIIKLEVNSTALSTPTTSPKF